MTEDERDCAHEWEWLTRHPDPGPPSDVVLANIICTHCSELGFEEQTA